jgi:hypothetical protein
LASSQRTWEQRFEKLPEIDNKLVNDGLVVVMIFIMAGLEITADQRSMIGRKLFLIGEEAGLPFILIGRNRFDHCLKDMLTCTR